MTNIMFIDVETATKTDLYHNRFVCAAHRLNLALADPTRPYPAKAQYVESNGIGHIVITDGHEADSNKTLSLAMNWLERNEPDVCEMLQPGICISLPNADFKNTMAMLVEPAETRAVYLL